MKGERKLTCATCGGELILDKERHLYKCTFCGVAYGYALFDGSAMQKAKEALHLGEFYDADLYFTFALSSEPHDFYALRGRLLCAGKWKDQEAVKLSPNLTGKRAELILKRSEEGAKNAADADKEYFRLYADLVNSAIEYYDNEKLGQSELKSQQRFKVLLESVQKDLSRVQSMPGSSPSGIHRKHLMEMVLEKGYNAISEKGTLEKQLRELQDQEHSIKTRLKESEHKLQPYYQKKKNCEGHIENLIWKIRKYSRQEGNETKSPLTSEEEQQAF